MNIQKRKGYIKMSKENKIVVFRGEIYYAELSPAEGSEQGGIRPVVILQNNVGNKHAPTTIVAPLTTRLGKHKLPTHVVLNDERSGLSQESIILLEQVRTISKTRLREKIGYAPIETMSEVNKALKISLGMI